MINNFQQWRSTRDKGKVDYSNNVIKTSTRQITTNEGDGNGCNAQAANGAQSSAARGRPPHL